MSRKYTRAQFVDAVCKSTSILQVLQHLGVNHRSGAAWAMAKKRILELELDVSHFKRSQQKGCPGFTRRKPEQVLVPSAKPYRERSIALRRSLLASGFSYLCAICGQPPEWNGKPLVLHVDHIDGDWHNNLESNLRFLCPHCHSQQPTSRGLPRRKSRPITSCKVCGRSCSGITCGCRCSASLVPHPSKIKWPDDELLAKMVWVDPVTTVANVLGVSNTAVSKRCRHRGIPTPPRGYWS